MACKWEYQRDYAQTYKKNWDEEHRQDLKLYRREYRKRNPDSTRQQWRKDTARFRSRHDPDELRERRRIYDARYKAKQKACNSSN